MLHRSNSSREKLTPLKPAQLHESASKSASNTGSPGPGGENAGSWIRNLTPPVTRSAPERRSPPNGSDRSPLPLQPPGASMGKGAGTSADRKAADRKAADRGGYSVQGEDLSEHSVPVRRVCEPKSLSRSSTERLGSKPDELDAETAKKDALSAKPPGRTRRISFDFAWSGSESGDETLSSMGSPTRIWRQVHDALSSSWRSRHVKDAGKDAGSNSKSPWVHVPSDGAPENTCKVNPFGGLGILRVELWLSER
uniref:Uncharacterized protein n=1 Tax=Haptolina ericina TaxID=156174 RepID=A0A7S3F1A6_9EUKA